MTKPGNVEQSPGVTAWELLLRTHAKLIPRLSADLERHTGLPLSWYDVLLELQRSGREPLRMKDLGNRVVLSRSRVSRIVDALARSGLVQRTPDSADGRAVVASLTAEGRSALRRASPVYLAGIEREFTNRLLPEEIDMMRAALRRVVHPSADQEVDTYTADSPT